MTDLQINIALAKAMGWKSDDISTSFSKQNLEAYDFDKGYWRPFDYRDPVIFVAICKHWKLTIFHNSLHCYCAPTFLDFDAGTIEKSAAHCVIAEVKRGIK